MGIIKRLRLRKDQGKYITTTELEVIRLMEKYGEPPVPREEKKQ